MRTSVELNGAKLFGIKPLGKGCRFGIKINSKKQDGGYTNGLFINCKHNAMLDADKFYTLKGFLGDNEYNGNNTLEVIVTEAIEENLPQRKAPEVVYEKAPMPKVPQQMEISMDEIPF